jgi:BASS family bile acid:Na+ symporter
MDGRRNLLDRLSHQVHERFLWLLLGSYAVAAVWPGPGLALRNVYCGEVTVLGERTTFTLPVVMLALLILNAGLGVQPGRLKALLREPLPLAAGLAANLLVPLVYIFALSQALRLWHNPDEVQNVLVGLALVASMPVAGSSTAWSQNAGGDLALSLGLVLLSTLLSPVTTPAALHAVGWMAAGDYAANLHRLAAGGAGGFLAFSVVVPSLLGIAGRRALGEGRARARPLLRLLNAVVLLLLNYTNAAVSLPQALADPDWDFLAVLLGTVVGLCVLAFAAGFVIARLVRADLPRTVALTFGLGMNNNGTGLVLASLALAEHPRVLLPIIFYNLVQHLAAGCMDFILVNSASRSCGRGSSAGPRSASGRRPPGR